MEMLELKRNIILLCKDMLQERADNAKNAMNEMQQSANEYGIPRDKYDSFKAQALHKKDMFAAQYQRALDDLLLLEKISTEKISELVEFGSIVITNKQRMIIAISLGKVQLDNETYFAISPQVPIFKEIQGLKKGDKFTFNGIVQEILDVY
jgi:hypothetical protein